MLSKTIQKRISEEAQEYGYTRVGKMSMYKDCYSAGAIIEATRAQQLEEVLEKILKMIQPHTPMQIIEIKMLIKEALNQYRNK